VRRVTRGAGALLPDLSRRGGGAADLTADGALAVW